MRRPFLEDYARTGQPPYGFANSLPWRGHPNRRAHHLIAQQLEQFFARRLAPRIQMQARKSTP